MSLVVQVTGSALIVAAFAPARSAGSAGRCVSAWLPASWGSLVLAAGALLWVRDGFLALEGVWCAVSFFSLQGISWLGAA